ncbi:MAG: D-aminoacyl-tRNA deacylase [Eubacteriales bacterium]
MIAVIQRVTHASVTVDDNTVGECGRGLLVLLGVAEGDTKADADAIIKKLPSLRIFCDEDGKMNLSLTDIGGEILAISNFTLLGNCRRGNRPDFMRAERPDVASEMYDYFVECLKASVPHVATGIFGADMKVDILNDGPVTMILDSAALRAPRMGGAK